MDDEGCWIQMSPSDVRLATTSRLLTAPPLFLLQQKDRRREDLRLESKNVREQKCERAKMGCVCEREGKERERKERNRHKVMKAK